MTGRCAPGEPDRRPLEPEPTRWRFPPAQAADEHGLVGVGADLRPGTILATYRAGMFPMPLRPGGRIGWWSPDPRSVIDIDAFHVSRSLRRSAQRFTFDVDRAFVDVVLGCVDPRRPHGWIDDQIIDAYTELHALGWAHSVEAYVDDRLVGGVYGLTIGGLFAAESMFHLVTDAGKAALWQLVRLLDEPGERLLDVQWTTPHLATLGARDISRDEYLASLRRALATPVPTAFA